MTYQQDFSEIKFPRFLAQDALRVALTTFVGYAENTVRIIVPFLVKSEILNSILNVPENIKIILLTRSSKNYLPNIMGAPAALDKLVKRRNIEVWINKDIHAKVWLIDDRISIVHSMNGTRGSEFVNFEAGIMSIDKDLIAEIKNYFEFVKSKCTRLQASKF